MALSIEKLAMVRKATPQAQTSLYIHHTHLTSYSPILKLGVLNQRTNSFIYGLSTPKEKCMLILLNQFFNLSLNTNMCECGLTKNKKNAFIDKARLGLGSHFLHLTSILSTT